MGDRPQAGCLEAKRWFCQNSEIIKECSRSQGNSVDRVGPAQNNDGARMGGFRHMGTEILHIENDDF